MNKKNLKITDRDIEVFRALIKYHLTGQMVFELSQTFRLPFLSVANARGRLSQLYKAGFLKRDQRLVRGRSNNENYYFLTKKSALLVNNGLTGLNKNTVYFRPISIGQQAHSFMLSEIMVKMEQDIDFFKDICRLAGFIRENNLIVKGNGKRTIKPDETIFLQVNGNNFLLFLEADLSTEVVASVKPHVRTFKRKIEIYSEFKNHFFQNEIIHRCEGITGYRVLIVCKSVQRLQNLVELAKGMNKAEMFWFTTVEWLRDRNCLFDRIWVLADGEFYALF